MLYIVVHSGCRSCSSESLPVSPSRALYTPTIHQLYDLVPEHHRASVTQALSDPSQHCLFAPGSQQLDDRRTDLPESLDKTKYLWFGTRQQLGKRDTVALSNISAAMVSAPGHSGMIGLLNLTKNCRWGITSPNFRASLFLSTSVVFASCVTRLTRNARAHLGARIRLLPTRFLQQCNVRSALVPAHIVYSRS